LIELRNVSRLYQRGADEVHALEHVSLEIPAGRFVALMGPSGSGKSTLLNIVGCLDRPTSGSYLLGGIDVGGQTDDALADIRNRLIGFVFQSFNLLPRFPAWKNVELPLVYGNTPARERKERALAMLEKVGLAGRAGHNPNELSGGEQQRVAIARALVTGPRIILADEPTGNLDSRSGEEIIRLMERLNAEGTTVVMVTHERPVAERAKRIVQLFDGVCSGGCN
jgi:putative ABC transport system ATP-binding protein